MCGLTLSQTPPAFPVFGPHPGSSGFAAVVYVTDTWLDPWWPFPNSDFICLSPTLTRSFSVPARSYQTRKQRVSPMFTQRWSPPKLCSLTDNPKIRLQWAEGNLHGQSWQSRTDTGFWNQRNLFESRVCYLSTMTLKSLLSFKKTVNP